MTAKWSHAFKSTRDAIVSSDRAGKGCRHAGEAASEQRIHRRLDSRHIGRACSRNHSSEDQVEWPHRACSWSPSTRSRARTASAGLASVTSSAASYGVQTSSRSRSSTRPECAADGCAEADRVAVDAAEHASSGRRRGRGRLRAGRPEFGRVPGPARRGAEPPRRRPCRPARPRHAGPRQPRKGERDLLPFGQALLGQSLSYAPAWATQCAGTRVYATPPPATGRLWRASSSFALSLAMHTLSLSIRWTDSPVEGSVRHP